MLTDASAERASSVSAQLAAIAELTARMLSACEQTDWATVSALEACRFELLQGLPVDCFQKENGQARGILREALEVTEVIALKAARARDEERLAERRVRLGRHASAHYLTNSQTA